MQTISFQIIISHETFRERLLIVFIFSSAQFFLYSYKIYYCISNYILSAYIADDAYKEVFFSSDTHEILILSKIDNSLELWKKTDKKKYKTD